MSAYTEWANQDYGFKAVKFQAKTKPGEATHGPAAPEGEEQDLWDAYAEKVWDEELDRRDESKGKRCTLSAVQYAGRGNVR